LSRVWRGAGLAALLGLAACHPHGPHVGIAKLSDLSTPLPDPYDANATPAAVDARLDAAFAAAAPRGKRVIVDLGGSWCSWCRMLAGVMERPEVKPFIDANFVVVPVAVSAREHDGFKLNSQVLQRFHVGKVEGVPWLVVADADGKVVASSDAITDDAHHTPQSMVDWLAQYAKAPAT
jgi:thiol-disulfide isomerase/thioredoxin